MSWWDEYWLGHHDYPPVQDALNFFKFNVDESFVGGFELKGEPLINFIPHLFWLTRCTTKLPEFTLMSFPQSNMVFSICKDGAFHIDFHNEDEQKRVRDFLAQRRFIEVEDCRNTIDFKIEA